MLTQLTELCDCPAGNTCIDKFNEDASKLDEMSSAREPELQARIISRKEEIEQIEESIEALNKTKKELRAKIEELEKQAHDGTETEKSGFEDQLAYNIFKWANESHKLSCLKRQQKDDEYQAKTTTIKSAGLKSGILTYLLEKHMPT